MGRTSDITTRIIVEALADSTASMVAISPQFTSGSHRVDTFKVQAWDVTSRAWVIKSFELPVADGSPLLLAPSGWAGSTLLMSAGRYYETKVLGYAQLERAVRVSVVVVSPTSTSLGARTRTMRISSPSSSSSST